ncbi:MAG: protein kinase [Prevotella sp.]|nr:protein kinase [Prevotella sp.]
MHHLQPNTTLQGGKYRIKRVLGQGGFGITYLATDIALDKQVAIKEFFPKDYCDRNESTSHMTLGTASATDLVLKLKAKFLKEVRNIAKLDHPGIIKIHAAFEENNTAYYVMDYIEGENLSDMVRRNGSLSAERALYYIEKVGEALQYIHDRNINHLDIKPANIMVRREGDSPILIDFGLSKQYDSEGQQTSTTPTGISHGYAPMEQYNDGGVKEFSPQTDIYSLAATLYFLLSGVTPPQATKLVDEELTFSQSIPANLIAPISKAMATSRKRRYDAIGKFIEELTTSEDTIIEPIPSKPLGTQPTKKETNTAPDNPLTGQGKKKWMWMAIVGAVVIGGLVMGALLLQDNTISADIEEKDETKVETSTPLVKTVTSMFYHSALGDCSYTGDVDDDNKPHGKGVATWTSGDGLEYDGKWVHGVMEGQTHYTQRSGDIFVGTFKSNRYDKGKYTIISTGDYFEGTFKNGQPDKGDWYDKNGNKY